MILLIFNQINLFLKIKMTMRVQLSRDPLFQIKDSPVRKLKQKQAHRLKMIRNQRFNHQHTRYQLDIEIFDPLPNQLSKYKQQTSFKKQVRTSKASHNLKKYIIEQERKLKCLRMERVDLSQQTRFETNRSKQLKMNVNLNPEDERSSKVINIPLIEQLFKNQAKQYILFENRLQKQKITKIINSIETKIIKSKKFAQTAPTQMDRTTSQRYSQLIPLNNNKSSNHGEQQLQLDQVIENTLKLSDQLQKKIFIQKKKMQNNNETQQHQKLSFYLPKVQKKKRKVKLQGVKSYSFTEGNKKIKLTPASHLLFELHRTSLQKDKKQDELSDLLKNSYQNRDSTLNQKSNFYDKQAPFNDLTPSNQFKLRQQMNRKLHRRLELSRQQVDTFIKFIRDLKQQYHVILNDTILQILKEVRLVLLSGKVMKISNLKQILKNKPKQQQKGYPNEIIIQKLAQMMV